MSASAAIEKFPLVSVITLVFNTGYYVLESFECVRRQNYPNLQHVIIDDCSTDNSVRLVEEWIKKNKYQCQYIKHEQNQGIQKTLEEAFALSNGKYFVGISDDLWPDNKLLDQVSLLEEAGDEFALVYGDTNMIDKDGKILIPSMFTHYRGKDFIVPSGEIFREIVQDFYFFIQASLIRLDYFKAMNYAFDKSIISEDWDWELWYARNYKILGVNGIYASYRWLETSVGRTNWTEEKVHNVYISQAKMLLHYYHHPKNENLDKAAIYSRLKRIYDDLTTSKATVKEKANLLISISTVTGRWELIAKTAKIHISQKMGIKKIIHRLFNLVGFRLVKNVPAKEPDTKRDEYYSLQQTKFAWLKNYNFKTIIDIGANEGQFAGTISMVFPEARIHCFEPLEAVFKQLKSNFIGKDNFVFYQFALGETSEEKEIFKNEYSPSSSMLKMLDLHKKNFDFAVKTESERISIRMLDETFSGEIPLPLLVKIDVQGYEMFVLKGGMESIKKADAIIIETSFYPLYDGQPLFDDIYVYLKGIGFKYMGNVEQLISPDDHKLLQADAVFLKIV